MNTFRFAQFFIQQRKQLKVTQEEIANYLGVSKAAVSKWEKGQSYPDIALLPKIATYFTTSIDELLGYEPQLTMQKIETYYATFARLFNTAPFEEVEQQIEEMIREYYACFPFLLKMVQLYLNYYTKAANSEAIFERIEQLCERIQQHSEDRALISQAIHMRAFAKLLQQDAEGVINLLGEGAQPIYGEDILIATAHTMQGQTEKAKEILQVTHYQHLVIVLGSATESILLDLPQIDETVKRVQQLIDVYDIEQLHPNSALVFYLKAASGYMMLGKEVEAEALLTRYGKCCYKLQFPLTLHGDGYFYLLDQWLNEQVHVSQQAPRSDEAIKLDLIGSLNHPVFQPLHDKPSFRMLYKNLQHYLNIEGGQ